MNRDNIRIFVVFFFFFFFFFFCEYVNIPMLHIVQSLYLLIKYFKPYSKFFIERMIFMVFINLFSALGYSSGLLCVSPRQREKWHLLDEFMALKTCNIGSVAIRKNVMDSR